MEHANIATKKNIAVFFGCRTPEHDVSVVTGLQVIQALDSTQFTAIPVYIAPNGQWLTGPELLNLSNYMLTPAIVKKLSSVTLDLGSSEPGKLLLKTPKLFGSVKSISFDVALLAIHGIHGEDGQLPAVMEMANIPYTGMRHFASSLLMNKLATKHVLRANNIPVLPCQTILRPKNGQAVEPQELKILTASMNFPYCVKPCNLGSSIGVAKVNNLDELIAVLPNIFKYDNVALIEPFVENLVEYNVSVGIINNQVTVSAIEKPKRVEDLLDFKQKYVANKDNNKLTGTKSANTSAISGGMLNLTRELNPTLPAVLENNLRAWGRIAFNSVQGSGFPRIDFLCNSETGQLWLNEINPCPGSFAYYLWEANKTNPILFTELLTILIKEAEMLHKEQQLPLDPTPIEARLFSRNS